jgi:hypothetical protein
MTTKEIVDTTVGALSTTIANISRQLREVASTIQSEEEAKAFVKAVVSHEGSLPRGIIKGIVTDLAVKHEIVVSLGDYGNGESLQLYASEWNGTSPGDWVSSSRNC